MVRKQMYGNKNYQQIRILSNVFQRYNAIVAVLYSYYKIADREETFLKMINAFSGNEPFQRFAIALGNSVLSKRCEARVCAHRENPRWPDKRPRYSDVDLCRDSCRMRRFTFHLAKSFNRGTLAPPTMSSLNTPSSAPSSVFPFSQPRLIAPSSRRFDFNSPIKFSHLSSHC